MRARLLIKVGDEFDLWIVIETGLCNEHGQLASRVRCKCGKEGVITNVRLKSGRSHRCVQCARVISPSRRTHGMSKTPTYSSWAKMHARCTDPNNNRFESYGARGITVCGEWDSFEQFLTDMGEKPSGLSIGRQDNDGPYCKDNCRWETPIEQARNTTKTVFINYEGRQRPLREVAEITGLSPTLLWQRMKVGKDPFDEVRVDSLTGSKGVTKHSKGKKQYQARIIVNGKRKSLGYFHTLEEAEAAYQQALNEVKAANTDS